MGRPAATETPTHLAYEYLHVHGVNACGGVAFEYDHEPKDGDLVLSEHASVSGNRPQDGKLIECGNCGAVLENPLRLSALREKT